MFKTIKQNTMEELITSSVNQVIPKTGDLIKGKIINVSKNEVIIDIPGLTTGIVRGWELQDESGQHQGLQVGDEVQATLLDLENERGMMELSFRAAGHRKAWDNLKQLCESNKVVNVKALEANKGGLIVELGRVLGFLPVSQLLPEHYPRVEGGNKGKILEKLKTYINNTFQVKVIDIDEVEEKLIVSEKAVKAAKQKEALLSYKVGDILEVKVSGIVDFGLFVELPVPITLSTKQTQSVIKANSTKTAQQKLEGLIHISEISWQRVDKLDGLYKIGDRLKAKIIDIDNTKVSLSLKRLEVDPWQEASKYYQVGQKVKGKVVKLNEFGVFVELGHNIHGLVHISKLSPEELAEKSKAKLEVSKIYEFVIVNFEPKEHRLGLSRKELGEETKIYL